MRLPRWLFLFWRRRIYLRSAGWRRTRLQILHKRGEKCENCGSTQRPLHVHHEDHSGQPKPKWWHFLPFARFFMFERDRSKLKILCQNCHTGPNGVHSR